LCIAGMSGGIDSDCEHGEREREVR